MVDAGRVVSLLVQQRQGKKKKTAAGFARAATRYLVTGQKEGVLITS